MTGDGWAGILNPGERVVTGNVQAVNNGDQVSE